MPAAEQTPLKNHEGNHSGPDMLVMPSSSDYISPEGAPNTEMVAQKKKKKKKSKKSSKGKEASPDATNGTTNSNATHDEQQRPPVLCISRNKHWRYISSYHVRPVTFSDFESPNNIIGSMVTTPTRTSRVFTRPQPGSSHPLRC